MNKWTVTMLAAMLPLAAGCQPAAEEPRDAAEPPAPTPTQAEPSATAGASYDFYLLSRSGKAVKDPRIVSTDNDHPCGPIDLVRVPSIPMDDPVFMPSYVVEFDAKGQEIRKWGVPNEAVVLAINADRLLFKSEPGQFWVTTDGQLEPDQSATSSADIRTADGMFDCPSLPSFQPEAGEQCFNVKDASGVSRKLAIEASCS